MASLNQPALHIVIGESSAGVLHQSGMISTESSKVLCLRDDLRFGPIINLETQEGRENRQKWIAGIACAEERDYLSAWDGDDAVIQQIEEEVNHFNDVYIWCGKTTYERLGTARVLSRIAGLKVQLWLPRIPNEKIQSHRGHFYHPECLAIMNPKDVHHWVDYFQLLQQNERTSWRKIWEEHSESGDLLRFRNDSDSIASGDVSRFDDILLASCTHEFQKVARIIGESMVNIHFDSGDFFLNWRLRELVASGKLVAEGTPGAIRDYSVSLVEG